MPRKHTIPKGSIAKAVATKKPQESWTKQPGGMTASAVPADYGQFLTDLKARIHSAQLRASISVNPWRKRQSSRAQVEDTIKGLLDENLPRVYSPEIYRSKCEAIFQHVFESYRGEGESIFSEVA